MLHSLGKPYLGNISYSIYNHNELSINIVKITKNNYVKYIYKNVNY